MRLPARCWSSAARTESESRAERSLDTWSSTSAFMGYRTSARTAAALDSPRSTLRVSFHFGCEFLAFAQATGCNLGRGHGFEGQVASRTTFAMTGKRNDSVFPEP